MSDTDHYSGLPIPTYSETPDGPAAFSDLRAAIAPHLNLFATTEADRNNRYVNVPSGTIVSSTTMKAIWLRTDAGWETIYYDSGWQSLNNVAWYADWTNTGDSKYRITNNCVEIYLDATYSGPTLAASSNGNLISNILTLPTTVRPTNVDRVVGRFAVSGTPYYGDVVAFGNGGSVSIRSFTSNNSLATGNSISGTIFWIQP